MLSGQSQIFQEKDAGNIRSGLPSVKSHGLLWNKMLINGAGVGLRTRVCI